MTKQELIHDLYKKEKDLFDVTFSSFCVGEFNNPVFGEGNTNSVLMFVGEAPGAEETVQCRPFVGKAGKQLDQLLKIASIQRDEIFVTNVVKYRPYTKNGERKRNRTPSAREIQLSVPLLKKEIETVHPKIIATLGNTPLKAIEIIFNLDSHKIGCVHGNCFFVNKEIKVFPLYHPASVIYNHSLEKSLNDDIISLGKLYNSENEFGGSYGTENTYRR